MFSSVALRAQIASVIDSLSKAAVAEISKVVEDSMVVLRLEVCQRENEIKKLKSNIEVLHSELRAAQDKVALRPDTHGRDDSQSGTGDERTLLENVHADKHHNSQSIPEVQVKREPMKEGHEETSGHPDQLGEDPALYEGKDGPSMTQNEAGRNNSDYFNLGRNSLLCLPESALDAGLAVPCSSSSGFPHSPFTHGLLGYGQHRNSYNTIRRRTVKRLLSKKGFICPYCGKCFERSGHLERHKRIHTGEKPYRCDICGRCFNQKCSLKEHMKIHRRSGMESRLAQIQVSEQKQVPEVNSCTDAHRPEEKSQPKAEDDLPKNQDVLPTLVQVKSEPPEENLIQPLFHGKNEQTRERVDSFSDTFIAFERDSPHLMSRLQNNMEMSRAEHLGGLVQNMAPFPGTAQLLPAPVEPSCSTFTFPGKPYGELTNGLIPQTLRGSSDALLISSERGMAEASLNHHWQRNRSFQLIKPKKSFICSYCGKVFERSGHLERHLRIHTGEKPYGCHICGRCFNQKSSLKGHMRTHRNGETTDALEAHHLMFTLPESQPLQNPAEPKTRPAAFEEQLQGSVYSESVGEQTLMVKVELNGEGFHTVIQAGTENSTGASDQSQPWTSGFETNRDATEQTVSLLLQPPIKDPPFLDNKEKDEMMHNDQYSMIGMQSGSSDVAPELQDRHVTQEAAVNEYSTVSDRIQEGEVLELNVTASGSHEDGYGGDSTGPNCFICSNCGQSFDAFSLFQRHLCKNITEQSFSCEICGRIFKEMSLLKFHLQLHIE